MIVMTVWKSYGKEEFELTSVTQTEAELSYARLEEGCGMTRETRICSIVDVIILVGT